MFQTTAGKTHLSMFIVILITVIVHLSMTIVIISVKYLFVNFMNVVATYSVEQIPGDYT